MVDLEYEKKKVTLLKITAAKADMSLKIFEKEAEIERIKKSIETQELAILELEEELKAFNKES